jgi:hypothetical protein
MSEIFSEINREEIKDYLRKKIEQKDYIVTEQDLKNIINLECFNDKPNNRPTVIQVYNLFYTIRSHYDTMGEFSSMKISAPGVWRASIKNSRRRPRVFSAAERMYAQSLMKKMVRAGDLLLTRGKTTEIMSNWNKTFKRSNVPTLIQFYTLFRDLKRTSSIFNPLVISEIRPYYSEPFIKENDMSNIEETNVHEETERNMDDLCLEIAEAVRPIVYTYMRKMTENAVCVQRDVEQADVIIQNPTINLFDHFTPEEVERIICIMEPTNDLLYGSWS